MPAALNPITVKTYTRYGSDLTGRASDFKQLIAVMGHKKRHGISKKQCEPFLFSAGQVSPAPSNELILQAERFFQKKTHLERSRLWYVKVVKTITTQSHCKPNRWEQR